MPQNTLRVLLTTLAFALALTSVLAGCTDQARPTPEFFISVDPDTVSPSTLSVLGTVFDGRSGEPLPGARITTTPATQKILTDNDGRFAITGGLKKETLIRLNVEADGFVPNRETVIVGSARTDGVDIILYGEGGGPGITLDPTVFWFLPHQHKTVAALRNTDARREAEFSFEALPPWLEVRPEAGTLAPGESVQIVARLPRADVAAEVNPSNLADVRVRSTISVEGRPDTGFMTVVKLADAVEGRWLLPEDDALPTPALVGNGELAVLEVRADGQPLVGAWVDLEVTTEREGGVTERLMLSAETGFDGRVRWELEFVSHGLVTLTPRSRAFPDAVLPSVSFIVTPPEADRSASSVTWLPRPEQQIPERDCGVDADGAEVEACVVVAVGDDPEGFEWADIEVTLVDAAGAALLNQPVELFSDDDVLIEQPAATTDAAGRATGRVASSGVGEIRVGARVAGAELSGSALVVFVTDASLVDLTTTTIEVVDCPAEVDGVCNVPGPPDGAPVRVALRVVARDAGSNPIEGAEIELVSGQGTTTFDDPGVIESDADGVVTTQAWSAALGRDDITATVIIDGVPTRIAASVGLTFFLCEPGEEVCDGLDNDCDGDVDDLDQAAAEAGAPDGATRYYADDDDDGFGDLNQPFWACAQPESGYAEDATDCDDGSAQAFPGNDEVCDEAHLDNDCNPLTLDGCPPVSISLVADPASGVIANGMAFVTFTTTIMDAFGDRIEGDLDYTFNILSLDDADTDEDRNLTASNGLGTVELSQQAAGLYRFTSSVVTESGVESAFVTVEYADPLLGATAQLVRTDGAGTLGAAEEAATFRLTLQDASNQAIPNIPVMVRTTGADVGGVTVVEDAAGVTDANGVVNFGIESSTQGPKNIWVDVEGGALSSNVINLEFIRPESGLLLVDPSLSENGCVDVPYTVSSALMGNPTDLEVLFEHPLLGTMPATLAAVPGSGGTRAVPADGSPRMFTWDSRADLEGYHFSVVNLSVTPIVDGRRGEASVVQVALHNGNIFGDAIRDVVDLGADPPGGMAKGDFNGDGLLDVAFIDTNAGQLEYAINDGTGPVLDEGMSTSVLITTRHIRTANVDGDGIDDILIVDDSDRFVVIDTYSSTFGYDNFILDTGTNVGALDVVVVDMDNDGLDDLAILTDGMLFIQENVEAVFEMNQFTDAAPVNADRILVDDINADGLVDLILFQTGGQQLSIRNGTGGFTFSDPMYRLIDTGVAGIDDVQIARIDTDAYPELIVLGLESVVFGTRGPDPENYVFTNAHDFVGEGETLVVADYMGNGRMDALVFDDNTDTFTPVFNGPDGLRRQPAEANNPDFIGQRPLVGDFSNDGVPDIIYASSSGIELSVGMRPERCSGHGIKGMTMVALPYEPQRIFSGDVNSDGHLDLVYVYDDNKVEIGLGAGDLRFEPGLATLTVPGHDVVAEVAIADVDGDGLRDVVMVSDDLSTGGRAAIVPAMSDGTYGAPLSAATLNAPRHLDLGDIDRDGDLDILVANATTELAVVVKVNDGLISRSVPGVEAHFDAKYVDIDHDGVLDIVVSRASGFVFLFYNGEDGEEFRADFTQVVVPSSGSLNSSTLVVTDYNNDGVDDVMATSPDRIHVVFGIPNTDRAVGEPVVTNVTFGGQADPFMADVNGDGFVDFAFEVDGFARYLNNANGVGVPDTITGVEQLGAYNMTSMVYGDFDGDGVDQVVAVVPLLDRAMSPAGSGVFADVSFSGLPSYFPFAYAPMGDNKIDSFALAHLDHDLIYEAISVDSTDGAIEVATDLDSGAVMLTSLGTAGADQAIVAVEDFDSDGSGDLVFNDGVNHRWEVWWGAGFTNTTSGSTGMGDPAIVYVATGDLDNDGDPDVAIGVAGGQYGIASKDPVGLGFTEGPYSAAGVSDAVEVEIADLDGDGARELVLAGASAVQIRRGGVIYGASVSFGDGVRFEVAHLTPDRAMDLVFMIVSPPAIMVAEGNTTGTACPEASDCPDFSAPASIDLPAEPVDYALGDMNNDGQADVVVSLENNLVQIYYNDAGDFTKSETFYAYSFGQVELADINHDGKLDVLIAGQDAVMLLKGR